MGQMPFATRHLQGYMESAHPLNPYTAFQGLPLPVRPLVHYSARDLWQMDSQRLPRALRTYRQRVRQFAQAELAPRALQADRERGGEPAQAVLLAGARAGYLSDLLPRPMGSLPPALLRYPLQWLHAIKMEELCAACGGLGLMLGANALGAMPIVLSGDMPAMRRFLMPAFARSQRGMPEVFAYAITEPQAGSDAEDSAGALHAQPGMVARRVNGGWCLRGRKVFISGADIAQHVSVFAALEDEGMASWTCFLVPTASPGFRVVHSELKMGQRASHACELECDDVFVADDHLIGALRTGWAINRATLNFSRIPVGAIALGIARGALETTLSFVCRQSLAGKFLIDHQDVQLAIADMIAEITAMRALIWHVASTFTPEQSMASIAKFYCSDKAMQVCRQALDLLGNHAFLHHQKVEKQFRDARLTQIYEGTNQINRLAVIEDLQESFLSRLHPQGEYR